MKKNGNLSINSDNIFPIIKKWLYSDQDIFIRELVSNGCDAITKLKKLDMMGEYQIPSGDEFKVQILVNPTEKTMTFIDNGLGMTAEEVEEYICQIAFSGATEFLSKYKDKTNEDQIIGHFGLGFYSAFMVADRVSIDTLSYKDGATAVHWECDGGVEYEITEGTKADRGTAITLYLSEDAIEYANKLRTDEVLRKYCSFMPTEIFLKDETEEVSYQTIDASEVTEKDTVVETFTEDAVLEEEEQEDGTKKMVEKTPAKDKAKIVKREHPINDTTPLWAKHPNECTEEEYKAFYTKVFHDYKEPLFWIHLNMDYPFNLKGILYFPKINIEYESAEGVIKLYNNQVFIADNIKEVIPEFLMLLKGVIDCPDLPLNVSRSALQNDGFVKKISDYITKKVSDKLSGMCKTDKENYEKYWDDISPFIKYGCLKDSKFCDKMNDYILFKNLDKKYITLPEYLKACEETHKDIVYYVTDEVQQSQYIRMFKDNSMDAIMLTTSIDNPFITHLEQKNQNVKFKRVDSDVTDTLKETVAEEEKASYEEKAKSLTEIFKDALKKNALEIKVESLKDKNVSAILTLSEESRRMQEMMKMYGMAGMDPAMFGATGESLVLNANNALVQFVLNNKESEHVGMFCEQIYDLAAISNRPLSSDDMAKFIQRSNEIMMLLTK